MVEPAPKKTFLFVLALLMACNFMVGAAAFGALHDQWGDLLSRHVRAGVVDYQGFKQEEAKLDRYLNLLAATDPGALSESQRLAYYINAYNSYTVKLILDNFKNGDPVQSIRKIGGLFSSPWDISFAVLGGKTYSLDNIEHDIIRAQFDEPRIHFAVNCASKSCPILISEPYRGADLDRQLEQSTRNFLEDTNHNYLDGDILYVSSIFKWYKEDFNEGIVSFFLAHTSGVLKESLHKKADRIRVK
ncbi:MAG: DUF547 domain-containing protein, partial [Desulfofustis sp.]